MSLRLKLFMPLAIAVLLLLAYMSWPGRAHAGFPPSWLLLGPLALTLLAVINIEVFVLRPLRGLSQAAKSWTRGDGHKMRANSAELGDLAASLAQLGDLTQGYRARLSEESSERQRLAQALREAEDRYLLAVERANDGSWEWELKTGMVHFSPRWNGMMGCSDRDIVHIEDWKKLIHPDDRKAVLLRLDNHLEALTPYFDAEFRLSHKDGRYRWIYSRGTAIRHASSKPYRMVFMDNNIHARKELEETLIQAAEGLSSVSDEEFYRALMLSLSAILGTRDNLVCHCVGDPPTRARTLAYYSNGRFTQNFEYDLAGTSCGAVIARREIVYCASGVCDIWPEERQYDRDSYIGVPMFDSNGKIIGHFACMDGKPMRQDLPHLAIFKIFSVRAAAELERTLLKQSLGMMEDRSTVSR
jgi:PAS domain S-box-containing protein